MEGDYSLRRERDIPGDGKGQEELYRRETSNK